MRLVLFSDLHLDTTFSWAPVEIGRARRANLRETLRRIVALAEEVSADAICSAGDLFEHEHCTPQTVSFLRELFGESGRPVLLAPGNHDPLRGSSPYATTSWSSNVTVVGSAQLEALDLEDGFRLWSAAHHRSAGTAGFLDGFRVDGGGVHYALFHGSEERFLVAEGAGKQPHAPFTADQIPAAGLDHALVGHFHAPHDGRWHTYPGNPDPLTFGEQGERAAVVLDVASDGTPNRRRHDVSVSRVHDLTIDVGGAPTVDDVAARARDALDGITGQVRITLEGELADGIDLRTNDLASLSTPDRHVLVRVGALEPAVDLDAIATEASVRGEFVRRVRDDPGLAEDDRRRVTLTGLRALDGRSDLEVP